MRLITTLILLISVNAFAQTKGALENPANESFASGIYMFSGWVCEANEVTISINGGPQMMAAYGTSRGDTNGICGDADNGFGLLFNFANLGTGIHEAVAYADGQEFGRSEFVVFRMTSGEFLRGVESAVLLTNFPSQGQEVVLNWEQAAQNFAIAYEGKAKNPYNVGGGWYNPTSGLIVSVNTVRPNLNEQYISAMAAVDGEAGWQAFIGILEGDEAYMQSIEGYVPEVELYLNWATPSQVRVDVLKCQPASECLITEGFSAVLDRLF